MHKSITKSILLISNLCGNCLCDFSLNTSGRQLISCKNDFPIICEAISLNNRVSVPEQIKMAKKSQSKNVLKFLRSILEDYEDVDSLTEAWEENSKEIMKSLTKAMGKKTRAKKEKDPNAPKRPLNAYMLWCKDARAEVKQEMVDNDEDVKGTAVTVALGKRWKQLSAKDKKPYEKLANEGKAEYKEAKEAYDSEKGSGDEGSSKGKGKKTSAKASKKPSKKASAKPKKQEHTGGGEESDGEEEEKGKPEEEDE